MGPALRLGNHCGLARLAMIQLGHQECLQFDNGEPTLSRPVLNDISVVIPTLGRAMLKDCLDSIVYGTAWPAELIVVEQGSNPQVPYWLAEVGRLGLRAEHVRCSQLGRAAGVNRGIQQAKTR